MTESSETPFAKSIQDEDIAKRAFELYEARGRRHGHDVEDWLQAEQELQEEQITLSPVPRAATANPESILDIRQKDLPSGSQVQNSPGTIRRSRDVSADR